MPSREGITTSTYLLTYLLTNDDMGVVSTWHSGIYFCLIIITDRSIKNKIRIVSLKVGSIQNALCVLNANKCYRYVSAMHFNFLSSATNPPKSAAPADTRSVCDSYVLVFFIISLFHFFISFALSRASIEPAGV